MGFEEVESREWEIRFLTPYLHFFSFQLEARGKKFSSFVCARCAWSLESVCKLSEGEAFVRKIQV
jgi:hypothetical protein